jgi:hypothetical protein
MASPVQARKEFDKPRISARYIAALICVVIGTALIWWLIPTGHALAR